MSKNITIAEAARTLSITGSGVWQAIKRGRLKIDERGHVISESLREFSRNRRSGPLHSRNLLEIIAPVESTTSGKSQVRVRCRCGTEKVMRADLARVTNSCGCQRSNRLLGNTQYTRSEAITFLGHERFGDLLFVCEVEPVTSPQNRRVRMAEWLCKCGSTKVIRMENVRRGLVVSCGCARKTKNKGDPARP